MTFKFAGMELEYLKHPYNSTDRNMRTVEIPIINELVKRYDEIHFRRLKHKLEIGNVISHYHYSNMIVLDKHETIYKEGVREAIQEDLMNYFPACLFDLIVSISTVEHISFGKYAKYCILIHQPQDIILKIKSLLWPNGVAYITVPVRYNSRIDQYLLEGHIGANIMGCMHRISDENEWEECSLDQTYVTDRQRPSGYPWSTGMVVLRINQEP